MNTGFRTGAASRVAWLAAAVLLFAAPSRASSLNVNAVAKYFGAFGMQVQLSGATAAYVEDDSPGAERRYRARFYINANALAMASGDEFEVFSAYSAADVRQLSVLLNRGTTQNRLRLAVRRDDGTFAETAAGAEIPLAPEWHTVEIDFRAAAAPAANDGAMAIWVDGVSRNGLSAIDNDQAQIGYVRWGAVAEVDGGTSGSFLLDEFDSRRDTYIGALSAFQDVPLSHPLWRFVHALYNSGVTSGCGNSIYCPDSSVTREQMAVFLLRSREGSSYVPAACTTAPFNDVPVSSPFCRWIRELVARGVTGGCGGGNYCSAAAASRAQMAVFLLVTKEGQGYLPPACTTPPFNDVPVTSPYCRWIKELVTRGITGGCATGLYCPDSPVTRGSMAVFLATTFALNIPQP